MNAFPTLYKKTSTGAIQYWKIAVKPVYGKIDGNAVLIAGDIITEYGQMDTDKPQITTDTVTEGKNPGKKNETTAFQQAEKETKARWTKQKKKGYVETVADAMAGNVDDIIEGGILPMLANKFYEHTEKVIYPCFVQPKLDGMRCIAIIVSGKCSLWSRSRKPINSVPHIVKELEETFEGQNIVLDGELYSHELKHDFERIMSLARRNEPAEGHEDIQYHIYDKINEGVFADRTNELFNDFSQCPFQYCRLVKTVMVEDESEVIEAFASFREQGYEGCMVRNAEGKYVNKRSSDLLKVKKFQDGEFPIVGINEGRGRLQGHVGSFTCLSPTGTEFNAKAKGKIENLKKYFDDHSLWKGKMLTVEYFRMNKLSNGDQVPYLPVGIRIREEE